MVFASMIQGSVGFGANVVAMPTLFLIDPALVPGPALFAGFGLNVLMLWRDRHSASIRPVGTALGGRAVGSVLGVTALGLISEAGLGMLVAAVVTAVVVVSILGFSAARTTMNMLIGGTVSGFGATTAGIGGPPVALLFQDATGPEVRGSLGAYFFAGNIISLSTLAIAGLFGGEELRLGLVLAPAAVVGFAATRWIVPHVDRGRTRSLILVVSIVSALAVVAEIAL